jgi:hypothetical protein
MSPITARVEVLKAIGDRLGDLPAEARTAAWAEWGEKYWKARFRGVPSRPTLEETSALARWVPFLPSSGVGVAVALLTSRPAALGRHDAVLRDLTDDFVDQHTDDVAQLLAHMMRNTSAGEFYGHPALVPILTRIAAKPGDWTFLREASLGLGIQLS